MEEKIVGVLFSGGLDSTYLVWKNLEMGNKVVPIYVEVENNKDKTTLEKNRIEALWKLFNEAYGHKIVPITYSVKVSIDPNDNLAFRQVPLWLLSLLFSQNHGVSELQIGYVGGDDAIGHLDDIQKVYKSYNALNKKQLKKLIFPLKKSHKFDLFEELPTQYKELIVSCEAPHIENENSEVIDYTPCGNCVPCIKIMETNNFGAGLHDKYRKAVVERAFNIIREHHDDNIIIEIDEETETERITRPYRCFLKAVESAHQLEIPFTAMPYIESEKL
jgi:7-cyano-7-deazaguanine synthase in queuosine biosynthesis